MKRKKILHKQEYEDILIVSVFEPNSKYRCMYGMYISQRLNEYAFEDKLRDYHWYRNHKGETDIYCKHLVDTIEQKILMLKHNVNSGVVMDIAMLVMASKFETKFMTTEMNYTNSEGNETYILLQFSECNDEDLGYILNIHHDKFNKIQKKYDRIKTNKKPININ